MTTLAFLTAMISADPQLPPPEMRVAVGHNIGEHTQPADPLPTFGHTLDHSLVTQGWIALFDGETSFGWQDATVAAGEISRCRTTSYWSGRIGIVAVAARPGRIICGGQSLVLPGGPRAGIIELPVAACFELADGLVLSELSIAPVMALLDDASWRVIKHPKLPAEKQTRWTFGDDVIRAVGGPGCVELQDREFGDFVLQANVTARGPLTNGGIFFRAVPGDFMNGYEAQVFNGCLERDPSRPSKWSTGAIDDRQNARRVVSRDGAPFSYTINARGPTIAVWINGHQQVNWTDERAEHENARKGRRTKPGAVQLQAHDAETDIEFANVRIAPLTSIP